MPDQATTRPWFIYLLRDPRTADVRYVGATVIPRGRFRDHLRRAISETNAKAAWLRELAAVNLMPGYEIIEAATGDRNAAERAWIAHFRGLGAPLLNNKSGGCALPRPYGIPRTCGHCAQDFRSTLSRVRAGRGLYCSRRCSETARFPPRPCAFCGVGFRSTHARHQFCSASCYRDSIHAGNIDRFWERVDRTGGPDACWPWRHRVTRHGHGPLSFDGTTVEAHRLAFVLTFGYVLPGFRVLHSCAESRCCNPAHLYAACPQDAARKLKDSGQVSRGEARYNAKLTETDVRTIRSVPRTGRGMVTMIASRYGVTTGTISMILSGRTWSHLD